MCPRRPAWEAGSVGGIVRAREGCPVSSIQRVAIIGLDCFEPSLVFGRWKADLPNLTRLCQEGTFGHLTSCIPPITVPAWSCMASSKDPGTLGIYGFRNRKDHTYDGLSIAFSTAVKEPRLWEMLSDRGKRCIVVGVPGTFPITRPVNGKMVTCFLTPSINDEYTHPPELKQQIAELVGEYMVDVKGFRTDNKQWLLDQIYDMTNKRFALVKHLITSEPWDLFWMVEMGTDRIHHGFWQYMDKDHHRYEPNSPFADAIHDYYVHIDKLVGELLGLIDRKSTAVMVVSDHGAKRMDGGICFNDWLIREGFLKLKQPVTKPTKWDEIIKKDLIDWTATRAWGDGGYYGRCFLNVKGREPNGIIPPNEFDKVRDDLIARLEALPDHKGRPIGTRAYKPEALYQKSNRVPPDLVVIFGDLHWRSVGMVGNPSIYTFENDTGPDDANHAQQGMYILAHPSLPPRGRVDTPTLYDVAPTVLKMMGQPVPPDMIGRPLA
ncbi:MAG: alkaline phosphatase family protein [Phycisphaerae bacterium]|nr:alkaline phosphatase family protein [Phycisphaerae bacterium]